MMTEETKARIRELRDSGYSYRQVADGLQIKLETIKSFCRREREKAQKANIHASNIGKSKSRGSRPLFSMPVNITIHDGKLLEQVAFRLQTMHLVYKTGI